MVMSLEIRLTSKSLVTDVAQVWTFSGMNTQMNFQITGNSKTFLTDMTRVRMLP
jgi:hypothetical protein